MTELTEELRQKLEHTLKGSAGYEVTLDDFTVFVECGYGDIIGALSVAMEKYNGQYTKNYVGNTVRMQYMSRFVTRNVRDRILSILENSL